MSVKILIDSASDITKAEAESLGLLFLPMQVRFGDEEYEDGVNLLPDEFYNKLIESDVLPQTSLINTFRFEEVFEEATQKGDEVVVITISSKLSGTYISALEASKKYEGKVFVVDSLTAAVGERLLCQYGLKLVKEGKQAAEIAKILDMEKNKIKLIAILNTLEYLKKGGRISSAVAFAGKLLGIKPVISLVDGEVKLLGKAMGSKKANNLLNEFVEKSNGIDFNKPYGVIYSGVDKTLMNKYIEDSSHLWQSQTNKIPTHKIGSTIGTHVGPGAVGVAFFEK